jgi:hypothetical protein
MTMKSLSYGFAFGSRNNSARKIGQALKGSSVREIRL